MGWSRQRRLNRVHCFWLTLVVLACQPPAESPVVSATPPVPAWIYDSTYSEMDRSWSFIVSKVYRSEHDTTGLVGYCSATPSEYGYSLFVEVAGGVESEYDRYGRIARVRIRRGDILTSEEWNVSDDGDMFAKRPDRFLQDLVSPGVMLEVPARRSLASVRQLVDSAGPEVAKWLEQRCPPRRSRS